jgi:hypothetical protein
VFNIVRSLASIKRKSRSPLYDETLFNMVLPVWGHISTHLPLKSPIRIIF